MWLCVLELNFFVRKCSARMVQPIGQKCPHSQSINLMKPLPNLKLLQGCRGVGRFSEGKHLGKKRKRSVAFSKTSNVSLQLLLTADHVFLRAPHALLALLACNFQEFLESSSIFPTTSWFITLIEICTQLVHLDLDNEHCE